MGELISIIVPVYNLQEELPRCIDSIRNQTYSNIEIVIVDDGSSDNSKQIIDEYSKIDNRIIPVYKSNGGVTSARLEGVRVSSGGWIGFVDGDDEIEANMYELLLKNAIDNNADISHCGYQMIYEDKIRFFYNTSKKTIQDNFTGLKDLLEGSFVEPSLCNKLYRRNLFNNLIIHGKMDSSIKETEDLLMNYYLFFESRASFYFDICPYHYIVRANSSSRKVITNNQLYDPILVRERIYAESSDELRLIAKTTLLQRCVTSMNVIATSGGKIYRNNKKQIREKVLKYYFKDAAISKKTRLLIQLIHYAPFLYYLSYRLFAHSIKKGY